MTFKTISVEEATYSRLISARASLEIAVQKDPSRYPEWMSKGRLSLDSVISFLLDHRDNDNERKRRHNTPKHKRKWAGRFGPGQDFHESQRVSIPPEILRGGKGVNLSQPADDDASSAGQPPEGEHRPATE